MKRNEPITRIMTKSPVTVHLGQKLSDVHAVMREGGFHHVPVVSGNKLVGILTSTDLLRVSYEYGTDPRQTETVLDHTVSIEQLMNAPITLKKDQQVRDAVEAFTSGAFHSLPVVDDDGNLMGIVTTTDVLRHVMLEEY